LKFKKGLADDYEKDRFLTFTEAAELLGSGRHTRISQLVRNGDLQGYKVPLTSKLRVLKSELLGLVKTQNFATHE